MAIHAPTLSAVALLGLVSCGQGAGTSIDFRHTRDDKGTPVATFGKDKITSEELQKRFAEMTPYVRARYQTLEQKKEYVEGLARFELIAGEAVKRGLANDSVVVEAAKRVMVERLLRLELEEKPTPAPDQAVSDYYAKHQSDYQKPEMVRLTHLFLAAPTGAPERGCTSASTARSRHSKSTFCGDGKKAVTMRSNSGVRSRNKDLAAVQ